MFKKKSKLDDALDRILAIEKRRDETRTALELAKRELREKINENLESGSTAGETKLKSQIAGHQAAYDELTRLLSEAHETAKKAVGVGKDTRRGELEKLKSEIDETTASIDRRRITEFIKFAKSHGVAYQLPKFGKQGNKGSMEIPTVELTDEELAAIVETTNVDVIVDGEQDALENLRVKQSQVETLVYSDPATAVNILLHERRVAQR